MASKAALGAIVVIAVVLGASFAYYEFHAPPAQAPCQAVKNGTTPHSQTTKVSWGGVTEYGLAGQDRWPGAVTVAPDGSVWFAEQEIPGVAHLFPGNGTVVEYPWPGYHTPQPPDCVPSVSVSGMALWGGRVWAADEFANLLLGVNPADGSVVKINTTGVAEYPYWLAVGPDGALWFTSDNLPARLGRVLPDLTLSVVNLEGLGSDEPLDLDFVNSSLAFISTVNLSTNSTTHGCVCNGHVYSFDPSRTGPTMTPQVVGGGYELQLPTSAAFSGGRIWVAQHGASSVAAFNFTSGAWTAYPTSLASFLDTTLPLEVQAGDGGVWFNEHYANKVAFLDPGKGVLTEYSESRIPITNYSGIQNDLAIAASDGGAWFTSLSGNYVGFVDGSYDLGFTLAPPAPRPVEIYPGGNVSFTIQVSGKWDSAMSVSVSDSENAQSNPKLISIVPGTTQIPPGTSYTLAVKVAVSPTPPPSGEYTLAVTVTEGSVQRTAYLFVVVANQG